MPQPICSKEEFARRGDEFYERSVFPQLSEDDSGKFVVIDIVTGHYEIASDELTASDRLLAHDPDAQAWVTKVGSR